MSDRGGIVRAARRPEGWVAPGPQPAGPGERDDLWPAAGEDLCFLTGDFRIFQRLDGHRWSLDDLVTAWFAAHEVAPKIETGVARALDLGCGIGSVLMMVAWCLPQTRMWGVEAQTLSFELAQRSLAYNGLLTRVQIQPGDLRDPAVVPDGPFDLITGTPPYFDVTDGVVSDLPQKGPCRFELRGGVEAYCEAAARVLAPHGRFVVCEDARQDARVLAAATQAGLVVFRQLVVIPKQGKAPLFTVHALAHATDVPSSAPIVERLTVRDDNDRRTPDFVALRRSMGMPP